MIQFVLDNSIAMRWVMASSKKTDQNYAIAVLKSMQSVEACVPNLWHIEAMSVLMAAEARKDLSGGAVEQFISQLENLPIRVDPLTARQSFNRTLSIARLYKLFGYDAAYLELAIREGLPLATLDKQLIKAANKSNVICYLK